MATNPGASLRPVLDHRVLPCVLGLDDPTVLASLYRDFAAQAAVLAAELVAAVDAPVVAALAHRARSACHTVGAMALGDLLARIEAVGDAGDVAALRNVCEEVPALVAVTLASTRELADRLEGDSA